MICVSKQVPYLLIKMYQNIIFIKEKFEDTKGVIRNRKSKNRKHNGQKKKDLQHIAQKTTDRATRGWT